MKKPVAVKRRPPTSPRRPASAFGELVSTPASPAEGACLCRTQKKRHPAARLAGVEQRRLGGRVPLIVGYDEIDSGAGDKRHPRSPGSGRG